ncbi:hypothetical protein N8005_03425 [Litorivicinus sp.]|nr:hypothetical protein [Litorivicinus sp.]
MQILNTFFQGRIKAIERHAGTSYSVIALDHHKKILLVYQMVNSFHEGILISQN